jgi:hypothetical protein
MGVFDYLRCLYPLPEGAPTDGYQTKDTPAQYLDQYEIRADGTLWWEDVTREWVDDTEQFFKGYFKAVGREWKQEADFCGEIRFYGDGNVKGATCWEFSAYFVRGQLKHLETLEPLALAGGPGR